MAETTSSERRILRAGERMIVHLLLGVVPNELDRRSTHAVECTVCRKARQSNQVVSQAKHGAFVAREANPNVILMPIARSPWPAERRRAALFSAGACGD